MLAAILWVYFWLAASRRTFWKPCWAGYIYDNECTHITCIVRVL